MIADDTGALEDLEALEAAGRALPSEGWGTRIAEDQPTGPTEAFLTLVRHQVYARVDNPKSPYGLECDAKPPIDGMLEAADALDRQLRRILDPMNALRKRLLNKLDDEAEDLETATRLRLEAGGAFFDPPRRGDRGRVAQHAEKPIDDTPRISSIGWRSTESDGRDLDVGLHRHWVDPLSRSTKRF